MAHDAKRSSSSRMSVVLGTGCAVIAVAVTALAGMAGAQEAAPLSKASEGGAPSDSVKIVAIKPDPSIPLIAGERVPLEVEIEYAFAGSDGAVTLVIQGEHGLAIHQSAEQPVPPGRGVVSLKATFTVPDTARLQVFTPLAAPHGMQAGAVDAKSYTVERRKGHQPTKRHAKSRKGEG